MIGLRCGRLRLRRGALGFTLGLLGGLALGAFGRFAFPGLSVVFPGIEDHVQPRHDLLDRRQLAGRAGLAARPLRPGLAQRPRRTGLAARPFRTGLALRSRLAARSLRTGPAGMTLRAGTSGLAARSLRSRLSLSG